MRQLKKDDFEIQTDAKGRRFVVKTTDELTKNHRENDEAEDGGIMMSNEGSLCPVASFVKYLSHLNPANDYLFQRPKTRQVSDSEVWYDNMVLEEHTLGKKVKVLSQQANLSIIYTNHSIRATAVTIFDRSGFEARHIMSVSGHRSESSIKNYCKTDQNTKAKMANSLMSVIPSGECTVTPEAASPPLLTDSQEEFLLRDLTVQTSNNQNAKQFNFYNCKVRLSKVRGSWFLEATDFCHPQARQIHRCIFAPVTSVNAHYYSVLTTPFCKLYIKFNAYFHCFEQVLIFNKRLQRSVASHYCGQSGGTGGHYS